jgi:hypothetical protein
MTVELAELAAHAHAAEFRSVSTDLVLPRNAVAGIVTNHANTVIDDMPGRPTTNTTTDNLIEVWMQP